MNLNAKEKKAVLSVSVIISIRLLGIFLILPTFSIYALDYPFATKTTAGVAFGIYAVFCKYRLVGQVTGLEGKKY